MTSYRVIAFMRGSARSVTYRHECTEDEARLHAKRISLDRDCRYVRVQHGRAWVARYRNGESEPKEPR